MKRQLTVLGTLAVLLLVTPVTLEAQRAPSVLATTPWTAAFARLAGAERVDLLAPYEMRHPPEYELRATDLRRIEDADLVVYAGYETMMDRLQDAIGRHNVSSVQITTTHTYASIEEATLTIAAALGTEAAARRNLAEIAAFLRDWREELRVLGLQENPVVVHQFQMPLAGDLGLSVAGRFGPGPMEAQQIVSLSRTDAVLVIDNWHNQVSQPLAEVRPETPIVSFLNFPGHAGTRSLMDVLVYNRTRISDALGPRQ
jgi:zinc transport system substrate-binding protein